MKVKGQVEALQGQQDDKAPAIEEVGKLKEQVAKLEGEVTARVKAVAELKGEVSSLQGQVATKSIARDKKVAELQGLLGGKNADKAKLEEALVGLKGDVDHLLKELGAKEVESAGMAKMNIALE